MKTIDDLVERIGKWSTETFGGFGNDNPGARGRTIDHAREELNELRDATSSENEAEELADVVMLCFGYAYKAGIDLEAAIEAKFAINQARRWKADPNGHRRHVKDGE